MEDEGAWEGHCTARPPTHPPMVVCVVGRGGHGVGRLMVAGPADLTRPLAPLWPLLSLVTDVPCESPWPQGVQLHPLPAAGETECGKGEEFYSYLFSM